MTPPGFAAVGAFALAAVLVGGGCGRLRSSIEAGAPSRDAAVASDGSGLEARRDLAAEAPPADAGSTDASADVTSERASDAATADVSASDAAQDTPDAAQERTADTSEVTDASLEAAVDAGFVMAAHPAALQVLKHGGPVVAAPVFTAITYDGYDLRAVAEDVVATIGASDYWKAATSEYGVGVPTVRAPIRLGDAVPVTIDDVAIQAWLADRLDGTHPEYGTPSANTMFVIFYPAATTVTNATLVSCHGFGGYHGAVSLNTGGASGTSVPYVVIPECAGTQGTTFDVETAASHELVESATDPFGTTTVPGPAWSDVDADHLVWEALLGGGEVTDLCQLLYGDTIEPFPYQHLVERSWSNAAAAAGHDPCVPNLPGEVYFAAAGVLPDTVTFHWGGLDHATKGVLIPVGGSRTIEVDLWSDAAPVLGPWTVSATDETPLLGGPSGSLAFSWDATQGTNGTKLHLTITVEKAAGLAGGQAFLVTSDAGPRHEWFGFVGQN